MHPAIILVNGAEQPLAPGTTVADVVAAVTGREFGADGAPVDGERLGVAAAVGDAVVPRSRWAATPLAAGESVEVITAMQGG